MRDQQALVVLGCALARGGGGPPHTPLFTRATGTTGQIGLGGALRRRVLAAALEWERARLEDREEGGRERPSILVATGGRSWGGEMEADAMAGALVALGVPAGSVVRERASLHTRDNARFTAAVCGRRGIGRVTLVTCGWHLERARMLFEAEGLEVVRGVSAGDGSYGWAERAWVLGKERVLTALMRPRVGRAGPARDAVHSR